MGAVVSPDGRFIYYTQRTGTFTYNARFPLWQVYRHDRETGDGRPTPQVRRILGGVATAEPQPVAHRPEQTVQGCERAEPLPRRAHERAQERDPDPAINPQEE